MMKFLSGLFWFLTVLLSDVMCAVVADRYRNMVWAIRYEGFSAPATTAFFYAIPFLAAMGVCVVLALRFRKKAKKSAKVP